MTPVGSSSYFVVVEDAGPWGRRQKEPTTGSKKHILTVGRFTKNTNKKTY